MYSPLAHSIAAACSITHTGRTALYEAIRSPAHCAPLNVDGAR